MKFEEALAHEALDRMAENARELGLDYEASRPYRQLQDNGSKYFGESWDKAEQPAPSQYGSPELQAMIVARAMEKDEAEQQGWRLVPYDPSIDMQEHGSIASGYDLSQTRAKKVYQAMIDMHDVMMEREPPNKHIRHTSLHQENYMDNSHDSNKPVAWWIPKSEQFCLPSSDGKRPFAKAWEPLYTSPQQAQRKPVAWMEMVVANLVREGVNKHRARELAQHFYTSSPAQRKPLPQTPPAYANINQRIAYKAGWRDCEDAHNIKEQQVCQNSELAPNRKPAQQDKFKSAYIEAMVASNEAGFSGMTAADTIRELSRMVSEQPAQRPWVGLTEGEIADIISLNYPAYFDVAQAIEAKLKEKNQ